MSSCNVQDPGIAVAYLFRQPFFSRWLRKIFEFGSRKRKLTIPKRSQRICKVHEYHTKKVPPCVFQCKRQKIPIYLLPSMHGSNV